MFPVSNIFLPAKRVVPLAAALALSLCGAGAADVPAPGIKPAEKAVKGPDRWYFREYRVDGVHQLSALQIEGAVYRYLGPDRNRADVELARAAVESMYQEAGYQAVAVLIPEQDFSKGIIHLKVVEGTIGRVRVTGAKYSSPKQIKKSAPSLREGAVLNLNTVPKDLAALNRLPGRQITPALKAGETPGTVDVDLAIKEKFPVGGSIEVNNRRSPDTSALRVNGSVTLNNLGQSGDTANLSFQVSPENTKDVKVFSGFYLFRPKAWQDVSFMAQATKQDSEVSTLGNTNVKGRGTSGGLRAIWSLPATEHFVHSLTAGVDYKYSKQRIETAGVPKVTPITIIPFSATYSGTWFHTKGVTEFNATATFHLRGFGSDSKSIDDSRTYADGAFFYVRGDVSHTHDLPGGLQVFGKLQGQLADRALLSVEQFSGGGVGTTRGYLEGQASGDNGGFASLEFRSPNLAPLFAGKDDECRFYVFSDGGIVTLNEPLLEQKALYYLASYGAGTSFTLLNHWSGSLEYSVPLLSLASIKAHRGRINFRAGVDF